MNLTPSSEKDVVNHIKNIMTQFNLYDIFINLDINLPPWSFLYSNVGKSGSNLSGGQKQIIHLLRIELNDFTKIVILDEPTSHLDSVSRDKIFALIKYINSKGKTILIITHDDYFKEFSDKVLEFYKDKNPVYIK